MIYFAIATLLGVLAFYLALNNKIDENSTLGCLLFGFGILVTPICASITLWLVGLSWLVMLIWFFGIAAAVIIDVITEPDKYVIGIQRIIAFIVLIAVLSFAMWLFYVVTGITLDDVENFVAPMMERASGK